jgi:hypothetical protein
MMIATCIILIFKVGHAHHEKTLTQRVCSQEIAATVVLVQFANATFFGWRKLMMVTAGTIQQDLIFVVAIGAVTVVIVHSGCSH